MGLAYFAIESTDATKETHRRPAREGYKAMNQKQFLAGRINLRVKDLRITLNEYLLEVSAQMSDNERRVIVNKAIKGVRWFTLDNK